jgi:acetate---CoA ligase (ADP-forming)
LFRPASIAVVGASEKPGYGLTTIRNLELLGYRGQICPVNPKYSTIAGYRSYPSVNEIPGDVDAVVLAIAAKYIVDSVAQCIKRGISNAVIYAASFAESGEEGKKAQAKLKEIATEHRFNIVGPNCLGLMNLHDGVGMWGITMGGNLFPGNVGAIMQSGNIGLGLMMNNRGIGFSNVVSCGNQAVLEVPDYINFCVGDPNTEVIIALIEGLRNVGKFQSAAENAAKAGKPVIVLKTGRSEKGKQSTIAHTGSLAGADDLYSAMFKKAGVTRVFDLDQLLETIKALSSSKRPRGNGLGLVAFSGGECGLMADLSGDIGLTLPDLSAQTTAALKETLPEYANINNPLDVTADIWNDMPVYGASIKHMIDDPKIDIVGIVQDAPLKYGEDEGDSWLAIARTCVEVAKQTDKPVVNISTVTDFRPEVRAILEEGGVPPLQGGVVGLKAIKHLMEYSRFLEGLKVGEEPRARTVADAQKVAGFFSATKDRVLPEQLGKEALREYGIPIPLGRTVTSEEESVEVAGKFGYPLVLKAQATGLYHKTDAGGVVLNIRNEQELRNSYRSIYQKVQAAQPGVTIEGILVEQMIEGGIEVIVGAKQDPSFGPFILFGLGGIFVEVLKDYSVKTVPLSKRDAIEMIQGIRAKALFEGVRGKKRIDYAALVDVLLKVSDFMEDHRGSVAELDINPLILLEEGKGCRALDALVVRKVE